MFRIGTGYDVHRLVEGRPCILGGVTIPHHLGLLGHSDADVLLHAISDALLGALALGDIGAHFPDTDPAFCGADSRVLLRAVVSLIHQKGYRIGNIDSVVMAERPKLRFYIDAIRHNIALDLQLDIESVSVKATTTEKLGFVGREEGIAAQAVVIIFKKGEP
jgi:2-C-methyl-D-erythritol 2,4-cyclodiphosphate synthase